MQIIDRLTGEAALAVFQSRSALSAGATARGTSYPRDPEPSPSGSLLGHPALRLWASVPISYTDAGSSPSGPGSSSRLGVSQMKQAARRLAGSLTAAGSQIRGASIGRGTPPCQRYRKSPTKWDSNLIRPDISLISPTMRQVGDFRRFSRQPLAKAEARRVLARLAEAIVNPGSRCFTQQRSGQDWPSVLGASNRAHRRGRTAHRARRGR